MKPVFDENGLATEAGDIRCYYYDALTAEYMGWSDEYINVGVSMPRHSTDVDPGDEVDGKIAVFVNGQWEPDEDYRGDTVYSTASASVSTVDYIGPIKDGYTTLAPSGPYQKWDGKKWVTDMDAQHAAAVAAAEQKQSQLRSVADEEIDPLQDAVDLDMATDEEKAQLTDWKRYRVLLNRVDTLAAPDINWPQIPSLTA